MRPARTTAQRAGFIGACDFEPAMSNRPMRQTRHRRPRHRRARHGNRHQLARPRAIPRRAPRGIAGNADQLAI
ncbi:hypothetical protein GLE_1112 [Lysobacter enzymogenes]|uniref:Uncharacterized protein n=1 Tax=Lysobacter enzymogenes TaxID=69 RepID=A0A0S2DD45_LYSEN|nr:hypothetical protein GLE_1112 [Lysobacter enzymogenes]